jgi:hypothetical protein
MPSTATRPELIDAVLDELGLPGAGQTNSAEDVAKIDGIIDKCLDDLVGQEVIRLDDSDEFPYVIFNPLVAYIAEVATRAYGGQKNIQMMEWAMQKLRVAARGGPTYEVMRSEYF